MGADVQVAPLNAGVEVLHRADLGRDCVDMNAQGLAVHIARIANAVGAVNFVANGDRMNERAVGRVIAKLAFV